MSRKLRKPGPRIAGSALRTVSAVAGLPVVDGVVRHSSDTGAGLARDWVEPGSGADKHRAYAFQWFAMAAAAVVAAGVLGWRVARPGRST